MENLYRLRKTRSEDLAALDALFAQSYPLLLARDYAPDVLFSALPLIAKAQPKLVGSGSYYLIEEKASGRTMAAGGWTAAPPQGEEPETVGHIRHVVTHPDATRKGLAAQLLTHSFRAAETSGLQALIALSTLSAVPFYSAMGFVEERELQLELKPGLEFPVMRMQRSLK